MTQIRRWWKDSHLRIATFWLMWLTCWAVFVTGITTNFMKWEEMNKNFATTDELSRTYLASSIIVLDLIVIMQVHDEVYSSWNFPYQIFSHNQGVPEMDRLISEIDLLFSRMETFRLDVIFIVFWPPVNSH